MRYTTGGLGALRAAKRLDVGPQGVEGGADLLLSRREVLVECLLGVGEALLEVQVLDLRGQPAVDVVDAERAGGRVPRIHDVEEVRVREPVPQPVVARVLPGFEPGLAEVERGVAFDIGEGGEVTLVVGNGVEVQVVLCCREESEEVLFELQSNELFGANVAVVCRARRVRGVPG